MTVTVDYIGRNVELTDERYHHIVTTHPELKKQLQRINETLQNPLIVKSSLTDSTVELYYEQYYKTPVTSKFLCVVVKHIQNRSFIITTYFTDTVKKGSTLWKRK